MGKPSRRPSRQDRKRRAKSALVLTNATDLEIVVVTSPVNAGQEVSLREDVRLVRSALLYADRVRLMSPLAVMTAGMAMAASEAGGALPIQMLNQFTDEQLCQLGVSQEALTQFRDRMTQWKSLRQIPRQQRRALPAQQRDAIQQLRRSLEEPAARMAQDMASQAEDMWEKFGASDLTMAAESGLLELPTEALPLGDDGSLDIEKYKLSLSGLIEDPSSHLMFDNPTARIVELMVKEDIATMNPLVESSAKKIVTGAGLIERLPAFPDSNIKQVLETREELRDSLSRYRRSTAQLSAKLASGPLDSALQVEVDELYRDEVFPSLRELRKDLSGTGLLREAAHNILQDPKDLVVGAVGAVFCAGIGATTDLSDIITNTAAAASAGLGATSKAAAALMDRRKSAQRHDLYYLLRINEQLY